MKQLIFTGIIGLTGYATCGKDFLCKMLGQRGKTERFALADSLKKDINPFLIDKYGVDVFTCSPKEKELVRPLLVAYGKVHRERSQATFFTSKITPDIIKASETSLVIVTDVRYADPKFPNDELWWLKGIGGRLVHITKYFEEANGDKKYVQPPNEDELINNKTLIDNADYKIEWPHTSDSHRLESHVDGLVEYLNNVQRLKDNPR